MGQHAVVVLEGWARVVALPVAYVEGIPMRVVASILIIAAVLLLVAFTIWLDQGDRN